MVLHTDSHVYSYYKIWANTKCYFSKEKSGKFILFISRRFKHITFCMVPKPI